MYWCCRTAASRLSLFSAWPHHSTPASAPNLPPPNAATPSVIIYFPPVISFSILSIPTPKHEFDPWKPLDFLLVWSFPRSHTLLVDSWKWLRAQPTCLDRWSIEKRKCTKVLPPLFILFFSSPFSDRYSYYYRPPTVLVKFFAYPVTSFFTYRV